MTLRLGTAQFISSLEYYMIKVFAPNGNTACNSVRQNKQSRRQMRRIEKAAAALVRRVDNDQKYRHISSGDDCAIRLPISRNYRSKDVTSTDISGTPALQDLLSQDINVVLAGDLNFRCEASETSKLLDQVVKGLVDAHFNAAS